ncbi:Uncharacterized protein XB16_0354 [Leptospira santarosai]|uniref:Uncharacterized protein n=1 Tax=Leptospira santarosai TaxID=28183 RepID=A0A2P1QP79_9LEPT|nr:Uncharacterized protein XB16_0354 [Leptospira santarosai]
MKGNRAIVNNKLIHRGDLWRRGRAMSERIRLIVIESKMTLRDIAFFYSEKCPHIAKPPDYMGADSTARPHITNSSEYMGASYREDLAKVIKGIRNTPRYVNAIEESWGLPIDEIRRIYREDKELEAKGEQLSEDEINKFVNWYIQILKTKRAAS